MSAKKLINFDDETLAALTLLGRDRMATFQELADEAFADLLRKHDRPLDLRDALKRSARLPEGNGDDGKVVKLKPKEKR